MGKVFAGPSPVAKVIELPSLTCPPSLPTIAFEVSNAVKLYQGPCLASTKKLILLK